MNKSLRHQLKEMYPEHRERPRQSVHRETGSNNDILAGWLSEHLPHSRPKPPNNVANVTVQRFGERWVVSLSSREGVARGVSTEGKEEAEVRCRTMAHGRQNQKEKYYE